MELLTPDEVRQLLAACSRTAPTGIRDKALLTVMYRAGLRVSEALDLRPQDINPDRGTIAVLHGKGDRSRTVAIDDGGLAVVQRWLDTRKNLGVNGPNLGRVDEGGASLTLTQSAIFCGVHVALL